jgi:membrane protein implicated in regulation of membrane protease activity
MTWESFYLVCFLLGLLLSALSLVGGMGHFGGHVAHLPHLPAGGHLPHLPHAGHLPQGRVPAAQGSASVPWWNAFSMMVFLCWFGATGYLLTRYGGFVAGVVLLLAGVCGLAGGAIVFFFLARVLLPHERELTADETAVVGAVGRVSAPIRTGGTGEIVYEQMGARYSAAARAEDGEPIQKQEEVFVVRYEKGIAYVRRWQEWLDASDQLSVVSDQQAGAEIDSGRAPRKTDN